MTVGERGANALFSMLNPGDLTAVGWDLGPLYYLTWQQSPTSTLAQGDLRAFNPSLPNVVYKLIGSGFTYDVNGVPTGGTLNQIIGSDNGQTVFDVKGFAYPMQQFVNLVNQASQANTNGQANFAFKSAIFGGNDTITGASGQDVLSGYNGDDNINGGGGNDVLIGAGGNDFLDGGAGFNTACHYGFQSDYIFVAWGAITAVLPKNLNSPAGTDGIDKITNIQNIYFSNQTDLLKGVNVPLANIPQQMFQPLDYIASYADLVKGFGANAQAGFDHYVYNGFYEGRKTTFDGLQYIASYTDLMNWLGANDAGGATHFIQHGLAEGRRITFDGLEYIASYTDLMNWLGTNTDGGTSHYITNGRFEGRATTFDGLEYIASYADLLKAYGANADAGASNYITNGRFEGRTTTFDGLRYVASYGDLIQWLGANSDGGTTHYIQHGYDEGRKVTFDPVQYLNQPTNLDLKNWLGDNYEAATVHYIQHGYFEGRPT
jgi:serralysin